jgi:integrating conjugative element protein (TIGR03757 family)
MKKAIARILITASFLFAAQASAFKSVEIFTIAGVPMQGVTENMVVIELDASARLDAEFSYGLSKDPQVALVQLKKKLEVQGESLYAKYQKHYVGLGRARVLGILKVPAVVVDGQYVIYGDTNVSLSLQKIKKYREVSND